MIKRVYFFPAIVLAAVLAFSCTVTQQVFVRSDGSGSVGIHIELKKVFLEYLFTLAEVTGETDMIRDGKVFDVAEVRKAVEERPGVKVTKINTPEPEILEMEFTFDRVDDIFGSEKELQEAGILRFLHSGDTRTLELYLDRGNYRQLSAMFPVLANPIFESLGPQEGDTTTEEEYLEIMAFAFGEEGPDVVRNSHIEVTVRTNGTIVSQRGGTLSGGNVVFRIPLVRVLLLDKPLDYALSFK